MHLGRMDSFETRQRLLNRSRRVGAFLQMQDEGIRNGRRQVVGDARETPTTITGVGLTVFATKAGQAQAHEFGLLAAG
jgi:hypothetical protein